MKQKSWISIVFSFASQCRGKIALSVLCAIISVVAGLIPYWSVYQIITLFIGGSPVMAEVWKWCWIGLGAYAIRFLLYGISTSLSHISASFCYFIRCKNDKIWSRLISVAAIWGIIRIVINNYQMIRYAEQYLSMNTTVRLVLQMAIYGLILYQTFTLTKKRKNAIEISNTENTEKQKI